MKNQTSLLTIATAVLLSGCFFNNQDNTTTRSRINKPSIGETEGQTNNGSNQETNSGSNGQTGGGIENNSKPSYVLLGGGDDFKLKYKSGKWEYILKDHSNKIFSFTENDLQIKDDFKETNTFKIKFQNPYVSYKDLINADAKIKFPITQTKLDYGHYGRMETILKVNSEELKLNPFFAFFQKDKIIRKFQRPDETLNFKGKTHAVLTSIPKTGSLSDTSYENLVGDATMRIGANERGGDLVFDYGNWNVKVKNLDLIGNTASTTIEVNRNDTYMSENNNAPMTYGLLGENGNVKEMIGTYDLEMKNGDGSKKYLLNGGFGMKKQ